MDHIADGFIALHKILLEKEVDIVSLVESAKEVDLEEMEESLISLKEDVSLCTEAIAKIKAALEEADHVVFLKVRFAFQDLPGSLTSKVRSRVSERIPLV